MSKYDNCRSGNYDYCSGKLHGQPKISIPKGFSFGGPVTPHNYLVQQLMCDHHPYFKDFVKMITEMERKQIMKEKFGDNYSVFVSGDFESLGNLVEENVREAKEKNAIKNSVLFNFDYAAAEEALKKAFEDPEMVKRFRENISGIFAHRNPKTNVVADLIWNTRKNMGADRVKKADGPRMIFEYIRKKKRGVVGLLVGYKPVESSTFYVGYSLCNPKDEFDLFTAFQLAFKSMFKIQTYKNTPQSTKAQKRSFIDRCLAYFKGGARGSFLYITHQNKFWKDFSSLIPSEVKEKMNVDHFSFKSFVLTPKKKEDPENKVNVMYANRVDTENVFDEETYHLDRKKKEFIYKNIRFGGCTHEKPSGRCVKITWEFLE